MTGVGDLVKIEFSGVIKTNQGAEVKMHIWKCGRKKPEFDPRELITDEFLEKVEGVLG